MASIVIAGDTSGSVTLQAPAVAGSTVLNLPATSGTIQTSGAGYTTNGVAYATSTNALSTGSALTFDGTTFSNVQASGTAALSFNQLSFSRNGANYLTATLSSLNYGASQHIFGDNTLASEWMRLTSTGLGIGTSSPATKMVVAGTDPGTLGLSYIYSTDSATQNKGGQLTFGGSYTGTSSTYFAAIAGRKESATSGNYDGYLQFLTRNAPSDMREVMRLDSAGNLGLGVTPSAWNSVFKAIDFSTTASLVGSSGGANLFNNAYYNGTDYIYKTTAAATRYLQSAGEHSWFRAASGTAGNAISFSQAMTLDSSGNLLVGTTSNTQGSSNGVKIQNYGAVWVVNNSSTGGGDGFSYYSTSASAYRFYVTGGGNINATNTTITAISDQRLKENIVDLDVGLDAIMALKPRKFDWKAGKGKDIKGDRGWIAQEFETVFPDLIDTWKDPAPEGEEPYKSVRADLIPILVKAIQEQQALINTLTDRISVLENK